MFLVLLLDQKLLYGVYKSLVVMGSSHKLAFFRHFLQISNLCVRKTLAPYNCKWTTWGHKRHEKNEKPMGKTKYATRKIKRAMRKKEYATGKK